MKKGYLELAKEEFNKEREFWRVAIFTRGSYYIDLLTRVSDRQTNHILILSSISPAILGIIFPLVNKNNLLLVIAFSLLFVSSILGLALVLYTIFKDRKDIPKIKEWEINIYKKFLSNANQNYSKAYSGSLTATDVKKYFGGDIVGNELDNLQSQQNASLSRRFIDVWYVIFLATFFVGLLTFFASFFCKLLL